MVICDICHRWLVVLLFPHAKQVVVVVVLSTVLGPGEGLGRIGLTDGEQTQNILPFHVSPPGCWGDKGRGCIL